MGYNSTMTDLKRLPQAHPLRNKNQSLESVYVVEIQFNFRARMHSSFLSDRILGSSHRDWLLILSLISMSEEFLTNCRGLNGSRPVVMSFADCSEVSHSSSSEELPLPLESEPEERTSVDTHPIRQASDLLHSSPRPLQQEVCHREVLFYISVHSFRKTFSFTMLYAIILLSCSYWL